MSRLRQFLDLFQSTEKVRMLHDDAASLIVDGHYQLVGIEHAIADRQRQDGRFEVAEPMARRDLADTLAALGPAHMQSANLGLTLAFTLAARGDSRREVLPLLAKGNAS